LLPSPGTGEKHLHTHRDRSDNGHQGTNDAASSRPRVFGAPRACAEHGLRSAMRHKMPNNLEAEPFSSSPPVRRYRP